MIAAYVLNDYDGARVGSYLFDALPRVGEHIVTQGDTKERYIVAAIEHWPIENDGSAMDSIPRDNTFIRVRNTETLG